MTIGTPAGAERRILVVGGIVVGCCWGCCCRRYCRDEHNTTKCLLQRRVILLSPCATYHFLVFTYRSRYLPLSCATSYFSLRYLPLSCAYLLQAEAMLTYPQLRFCPHEMYVEEFFWKKTFQCRNQTTFKTLYVFFCFRDCVLLCILRKKYGSSTAYRKKKEECTYSATSCTQYKYTRQRVSFAIRRYISVGKWVYCRRVYYWSFWKSFRPLDRAGWL